MSHPKAVDTIHSLDPRRDTEGLGTGFLMWVIGYAVNLTNIYYTYIQANHPILILFVYLFSYSILICYYFRLQNILKEIDKEFTRSYINTKQRYHKGRWNNIPKEKSRSNAKTPRRAKPKDNKKRKKYTFNRKPSPHLQVLEANLGA